MLELSIDIGKNLFIVVFIGISTDEDIIAGVKKAGTLLPQLKSNLTLIMDLSNHKESSAEQGAMFNKIIKSINDKIKIKTVVRIVGESKTILQNLCKMDKLFKMDYVKYVPTMEDALKFIEGVDYKEEECK